MPSVSVAELVRRAQGGDGESFSELVRRFQDLAVGFAYARRRDRQWAFDVAQEAFLSAFTKLPELREPAAFPGWFRRILVKPIDREQRKHAPPLVALAASGREREAAAARGAATSDPQLALERAELGARLRDEVRALPDALRTAVLLFYAGEQSLTEVASFLQVPTGTVKRRLHDARARLKERMFDVIKEAFEELRPSRSPEFTERVRVLLEAVAAGSKRPRS